MRLKKFVETKRTQIRAEKVTEDISKYVMDQFIDGESIDKDFVGDYPLNLFLVDLNVINDSLARIEEAYNKSNNTKSQFQFVKADYGGGKSQFRNRVKAHFQPREVSLLNICSANIQVDTLDSYTLPNRKAIFKREVVVNV